MQGIMALCEDIMTSEHSNLEAGASASRRLRTRLQAPSPLAALLPVCAVLRPLAAWVAPAACGAQSSPAQPDQLAVDRTLRAVRVL